MATWQIEKHVFDHRTDLIQEIKDQGHNVKVFEELPTGDYVYYGSMESALKLKSTGLWLTAHHYDCRSFYPVLEEFLLNHDYKFIEFKYLANLNYNYELFIRPASGLKLFAGKVVAKDSFEKDLSMFEFYGIDPMEMCVYAPAKSIEFEWRFLIVDGEVITGSQYKPHKIGLYPNEAFDLAAKVAERYNPDRCWTVDICQSNGECKLLEIGTFSCADLYRCDVKKVVQSVSNLF